MTADALTAYDLTAPARLLVPRYSPLLDASTPEGRARLARQRAEAEAREARAREQLADARARWLDARARLAGNVPAVLVLDLHRPDLAGDGVVCTECREASYDYTEPVPWECPTYRAVTGES